jgi:RHS repeat-associated protein
MIRALSVYDASGDFTMDTTTGNQYLYDGEGRICAVKSEPVPGTYTMVGYVYDAGGNRVAKGTITQWSCDPSVNGFMTANGNETDYILGPGGEQVTEMSMDANGTMNWQRTYVYAGGTIIATYDPNPDNSSQPLPSFRLTDWLGTMRATTDAYGVAQGTCTGLPYGDGVTCSGDIPDNHHFTGKERDAETGNDYFGARYFASSMGRWMSPDWSAQEEPVPYAKLGDPQSLNLYAYLMNNPLAGVDADGHGDREREKPQPSEQPGGQDTLHVCTGAEQGAGKCSGGDVSIIPGTGQQQSGSSSGGGFWSGLKHGFSNLLHGHLWNYVKTSVSAFIVNTWGKKDPSITFATDTAGAVGIAAPKISKELGVPYLSAGASIWNDHSLQNITTNGLGFTEAGEGLVFPSLVVDFMNSVDPHGPEDGTDMPLNFSIPKEPVPSGLDTYSGPSDSSGGLGW